MSTGKRLAKRSIIGTRVCAPGGDDGLWYSGVIQAVKTPATGIRDNNCINLTPNTKYTVRFDVKMEMVRREFKETELIGPGFRGILDVKLKPGQKVFLTLNGRESSGEVIKHDDENDEVTVMINGNGQESMELKKRLEELRLLESRRSARLADQERDTDFARLADMAGDRRRQSHSIDVPLPFTQNGSRKRRPSFTQDERDLFLNSINDDDPMDECNAALVLMSLSCSPHSPRVGCDTALGSSPGSSSASWSTGSSSPPLSDDNSPPTTEYKYENRCANSLSTSDEGIAMDYNEDMPRKRRANQTIYQCTWKGCRATYTSCPQITAHVRNNHLGPKKPGEDEFEEEFYYTEIEDGLTPSPPSPPTLSHRDMARPPHEDPEYQRQIVGNYRQGLLSLSQTSIKPPLPLHNTAGSVSLPNSSAAAISQHHSYHSWSQQSPTSPQKHVRLSPRPSTSYAPYPSPTYSNNVMAHHITHHSTTTTHSIHSHVVIHQQHPNSPNNHRNGSVLLPLSPTSNTMYMTSPPTTPPTNKHSPLSPNRRTRGENKKCRKVYGMDNKEQWCTQCKWKKACSRFGD